MKRQLPVFILLTFFVSLCLVGGSLTMAADLSGNPAQVLEIEGRVLAIDIERSVLTIRDQDRQRHNIHSGMDTIFVGFNSLNELGKKQEVKLWYQVDADGLKAIKIEKKLDVGCG